MQRQREAMESLVVQRGESGRPAGGEGGEEEEGKKDGDPGGGHDESTVNKYESA